MKRHERWAQVEVVSELQWYEKLEASQRLNLTQEYVVSACVRQQHFEDMDVAGSDHILQCTLVVSPISVQWTRLEVVRGSKLVYATLNLSSLSKHT